MAKKQYLPPAVFKEEYYKCVAAGECSNKLLLMFESIGKHYSTKFNNNLNKTDSNACINYAVTEAWIKWNKFDETRTTNLFAFFTTMISNDMAFHYNTITHGKNKSRYISLDALFANNKD